jgi:hypothetical protein
MKASANVSYETTLFSLVRMNMTGLGREFTFGKPIHSVACNSLRKFLSGLQRNSSSHLLSEPSLTLATVWISQRAPDYRWSEEAHASLREVSKAAGRAMPVNRPDMFMHPLDCSVINYLHTILSHRNQPPVDSVKGIFQEPPELYPRSAFMQKNHIQIAVRNLDCIKGVFRVPKEQLDPSV